MESGIYYLMGDAIPMQLIIVPRLSKTNNYWLNNLRNDLKSGGEIRNFIEKYGENKNSKLYQALADTIMRANWQELKEERKKCVKHYVNYLRMICANRGKKELWRAGMLEKTRRRSFKSHRNSN